MTCGVVGWWGLGGGAINACNETWDGNETYFFFSALPEFFICGNICLKKVFNFSVYNLKILASSQLPYYDNNAIYLVLLLIFYLVVRNKFFFIKVFFKGKLLF